MRYTVQYIATVAVAVAGVQTVKVLSCVIVAWQNYFT